MFDEQQSNNPDFRLSTYRMLS